MTVSPAADVPFEPGPRPGRQRLSVWRLRWGGVGDAERPRPIAAFEYARGVKTFCDVGTWQVRFPIIDEDHDVPREGDWLAFVVGAETVESGPITKCRLAYSASTGTLWCDAEGVGEESALNRVILPDPARGAREQTTRSHDARSGVASTVLIGYVQAQASSSPAAHGERQRATGGVAVAPDPLVGANISLRERYSSLLDALQRGALLGSVGFRVVRPLGGEPTFEVYQPRDRSAAAVFDVGRGNVESMAWEWEAPSVTTVIAGGQGELTSRLIVDDHDYQAEDAWHRRSEVFRDHRSESSAAQLQFDNRATLLDGAARESITVKPTDSPLARYGDAYRLGDIVRARMVTAKGTVLSEVVDRVQQVSWRATESGFVASPVIGTNGAVDLTGRRSRDLQKRLTQIEGAQ